LKLVTTAVAAFALLTVPHVALAAGKSIFKLDKIYDKCGEVDPDQATYRNCIYEASGKLAAKMSTGVLCSSDTCLVKIPCVTKNERSKCQGSGFKIKSDPDDSGYSIVITLASGRVAHYGQCGSCAAMEPVGNEKLDLRLIGTEKYEVLEFPTSEQVK
jgi:hypothetical protein